MRAADLRFYLVLDPDLCGGAEGMAATTRAALRGGVTFLQLRAPTWKKRAVAECARALLPLTRAAGVPFVIDDEVDVALAVGADGVHVGQRDLSPEDCRRILGPKRIVGLSVSNAEECRAVPTDLVDYLGIGPVFPQNTKADAAPHLGIEGLRELVRLTALPTVAIGGIKSENVADVLASGTDGVAVVSAVCGQPSPFEAARLLSERIRSCD